MYSQNINIVSQTKNPFYTNSAVGYNDVLFKVQCEIAANKFKSLSKIEQNLFKYITLFYLYGYGKHLEWKSEINKY